MYDCISGLSILMLMPLFYMSVVVSTPPCSGYCSFVLSFKIENVNSPTLGLQDCFGHSVSEETYAFTIFFLFFWTLNKDWKILPLTFCRLYFGLANSCESTLLCSVSNPDWAPNVLPLAWCVACTLSCFSRIRLFTTLWTVTCQAPLSMAFSKQQYWSGLPCPPPGGLPKLGIKPASPVAPALQADSLPLRHLGSPFR